MKKKKDDYIPAKPLPDIPHGSDRNMTDQGHRHYHADEIGPDTSIIDWQGTQEIDTYEGANRSPIGNTPESDAAYRGEEGEEEEMTDE